MSLQRVHRKQLLLVAVFAFAGFSATHVIGANGTWLQTVPGTYSWDDTTNNVWQGNVPADGAGFTANFNTINPTGDITVNLDIAPHSIGSLIFGDTDTSSAAGWNIGGTNGLTMDTGLATPATITVNAFGAGKVVTINSPFFSFSGLNKTGAGTLVLTNATNSLGGTTTVSGGTLQGNATSLGAVDILDNANVTFDQGAAGTFNNTISGTGTVTKIGGGVLTFALSQQNYTGATIVNAGGLTVNGTLASQSLTMGGGTLTLALTAGNPVNFTTTTVNGPSTINAAVVTGTAALGAITRSSGGAVNFVSPTTAPGIITTTSANDATGILGGWATVGGNDYATSNAGTIAAFTGYVNDVWAAGNNTRITQQVTNQSDATTNTLRIGGDSDAASVTFGAAAAGNTITVNTATGLQVGALVQGTGIPANTRITAINGTTVTVSNNVPITADGTALTFGTLGTATINLTGVNSVAGGGILTNGFSPAVTFNGGSLTGASGGGDLIFHQYATASGNMTVNSTIVDNGGPTGLVKTGTGTVILTANNTYTGPTTVGAGTLQVGNGGSTGSINLAGNIVNNGTIAFNRPGLAFNFTKQIPGSGGFSFISNPVTVDFTAVGAPSTNILSTGTVSLNNSSLTIKGGASGAVNSQTLGGLAVAGGLNTLTLDSGTGTLNVVLGAMQRTPNSGAMLRIVPAANGTIFANTAPGAGVIYQGIASAAGWSVIQGAQRFSQKQSYATYGLSDYAAVNTTTGQILPGDSITGFWTTTSPTANNNNEAFDLRANATTGSGVRGPLIMRFNTPGGTANTYTIGANPQILPNVLVTPNMGAENVLIAATGSGNIQAGRNNGGDNSEGYAFWQNNPLGYLTFNVLLSERNGFAAMGASYAQAGAGTVVLSFPAGNTFTGQSFLNEGYTVIGSNQALGGLLANATVTSSSTASNTVTLSAIPNGFGVGVAMLGQTVTAINGTTVTLSGNAISTISSNTAVDWNRAVNLNGGHLLANATFALQSTSATNPAQRSVNVVGAGGALAATTGNTLTVSGLVSGEGVLTIGTGTIPGSGPGTANPTPVIGDGTVALSRANTYTGGTIVANGTLLASNTSGSATGTGSVAVNSGGHLGGNGTISGIVNINTGGHLSPGTSTGTLTVGSLNLATGSIYDAELSTASNDRLISTNGLSVASGTGVNLFSAGTTDPYQINGSYTLFTVNSGSIPSPATLQTNFSILNAVAGGTYTWGVSGTNITLQITGLGDLATWNVNGGGTWNLAGNWNPTSVPNSAASGASFGNSTTAPGTAIITLDGNRTVGSLAFNNTNGASYSIQSGSGGNLILDNLAASATIGDGNGNHTVAADVVLNSNLLASVTNAADTLTISGNISGAKNLTVSGGAGKLLLSGNNSYANTTIGAGSTLQIGSGGTAGSLGTGPVTANGSLIVNRSNAYTLANDLTGSGTLVQSGTGATTLTSVNNAGTWGTTINAGSLLVGTGSALGTGPITMSGGTLDLNGYSATAASLSGTGGTIDNVSAGGDITLTLNQAGNTTYSGNIANTSGTLTLIKNGAGTLTLSGTGTNEHTIINNGQLIVGSTSAFKTGSILETHGNNRLLIGNATLQANYIVDPGNGSSTPSFDVLAGSHAVISGNVSMVNPWAGGGAQFRFDAGTNSATTDLTITGNMTVAGTNLTIAMIERGSLIFANNAVFNSTPNFWFFRGQGGNNDLVIRDNAQVTATGGFTLASGGGTVPANVNFTIGDSALASAGNNTFELNGAATTATLNLNGGTLQGGSFTKSSGGATIINFNGVTIRAATSANNVNFMPAFGTTTVNMQTGGVKFDSNGNDITVALPLTHDPALDTVTPTPDGGLVKSSGGTLALQGFNTYTGPTTISGGTLSVQVSGGISSTSKVTLAGGKLDTFGVSHTFATAPLQVTANSAIDMGAGSSILQFANSAATPWAAGSLLSVVNWTGTAGVGGGTDQLLFGPGGLTTGVGSQVSQIHFQGFNGATLLGTGEVVPATITTRVLGDWNVSGALDANDLAAMLTALTDLNTWKTSHSLSTDDVLNIGDVNLSGSITNADIQAELDALITGGFGSVSSVPEPSALVLLTIGGILLTARSRRCRRLSIA